MDEITYIRALYNKAKPASQSSIDISGNVMNSIFKLESEKNSPILLYITSVCAAASAITLTIGIKVISEMANSVYSGLNALYFSLL